MIGEDEQATEPTTPASTPPEGTIEVPVGKNYDEAVAAQKEAGDDPDDDDDDDDDDDADGEGDDGDDE